MVKDFFLVIAVGIVRCWLMLELDFAGMSDLFRRVIGVEDGKNFHGNIRLFVISFSEGYRDEKIYAKV